MLQSNAENILVLEVRTWSSWKKPTWSRQTNRSVSILETAPARRRCFNLRDEWFQNHESKTKRQALHASRTISMHEFWMIDRMDGQMSVLSSCHVFLIFLKCRWKGHVLLRYSKSCHARWSVKMFVRCLLMWHRVLCVCGWETGVEVCLPLHGKTTIFARYRQLPDSSMPCISASKVRGTPQLRRGFQDAFVQSWFRSWRAAIASCVWTGLLWLMVGSMEDYLRRYGV